MVEKKISIVKLAFIVFVCTMYVLFSDGKNSKHVWVRVIFRGSVFGEINLKYSGGSKFGFGKEDSVEHYSKCRFGLFKSSRFWFEPTL